MTHQRSGRNIEKQGENPAHSEGMKDALTRRPEKETKVPEKEKKVSTVERVERDQDQEAAAVLEQNKEKHIAFAEEVKDKVVGPNMTTEEVAMQSALALREQAENEGMPLEELAFETLRKVNYPKLV